MIREKVNKSYNVIKRDGFFIFFKKLFKYINAYYLSHFDIVSVIDFYVHKNRYKKLISEKINDKKVKRIIFWRSSFGWEVELFQRPQHISNNLAEKECLVIYETSKMTDSIRSIKQLKSNLLLVNYNNQKIRRLLHQELEKTQKPKYIQIYSTDWKLSSNDLKNYIKNNYKIIYEYIDDLSPEIAGTGKLPQNIIEKYQLSLDDSENIYIVTTADALYQDILGKRGNKKLIFSTNGVDYDFFQEFDKSFEFEPEFLKIINNGKINLCYYGALASWFDYDLIKRINKINNYNIVLFGIKYDDSYDKSGINKLKNVYFFGAKKYNVLKNYASKMDILMIPFLINDITNATSPVKLFEYMALKKPIITTMLPECQKYKSVITTNEDEFIKNLKLAYDKIDDRKYIKLLDKEAKENDWDYKAKLIVDMIKKDEK